MEAERIKREVAEKEETSLKQMEANESQGVELAAKV
jgi:hypothetical protein